jgi:hypothetical protein
VAESVKRAALAVIERMPEDASYEDIIYELYVRQRVERGLLEVAEGKTVPQGEIMSEIDEWLLSLGR